MYEKMHSVAMTAITLIAVSLLIAPFLERARAQDYPNRPVQVIVPFPGGSGSDSIARIVFDRLGVRLGQRFVIDNRPAAGGVVGTADVAAAPADGYTILFDASGPLTLSQLILKSVPYDPARDFSEISRVAVMPTVFAVSTKLPVSSVAEFVAYAKAQPVPLTYSSVGIGSASHLSAAYFAFLAKIKMTHVSYRMMAQLVSDLMTGEVPVSFTVLSNIIGPMKTNAVRAIAVSSEKRLSAIPEVPALAEYGYEMSNMNAWFALLAPKGTPRSIVERLNQELRLVLENPKVVERFTELGAVSAPTSPEELAQIIATETARWREVIARTGVAIEK